MPALYPRDAPRHARIFEYLRQSNQAELTTSRVSEGAEPVASITLEDWCALAVRSLTAEPSRA